MTIISMWCIITVTIILIVYNKAVKLNERVSTMKLYGKFCIGHGSEQLYITKHCAEPNMKTFYEKAYSKTDK